MPFLKLFLEIGGETVACAAASDRQGRSTQRGVQHQGLMHMSARVLVAYAASTGFTSRQAAAVGSQIAAVGDLEVDVQPIAYVRSVEPYVAVFLGWSGHSRAGRRETLRFLTRNAPWLPTRKIWVVHHQPGLESAPAAGRGPVRLSRLLVRQGVPAQAYRQNTTTEVAGLVAAQPAPAPTPAEPAMAG
jgi:hypothetical protein